jgi:hypothetical protein
MRKARFSAKVEQGMRINIKTKWRVCRPSVYTNARVVRYSASAILKTSIDRGHSLLLWREFSQPWRGTFSDLVTCNPGHIAVREKAVRAVQRYNT